VEDAYGPGMVPLPGRTTFYKLIDVLSAGRHTFGSAVTRPQTANRPDGPFTPTFAATAEFLQVTSLITDGIFMREIPGGTRARHQSRPVDLPEHRYRPQRSERAATFRSAVPRGPIRSCFPRPQLGDQPVAALNRAFVTRSPSRTTL
jgi:hypothetical protein